MSRLQTNSEKYRQEIEARNLYTPEDPYRLEEGRVIRTINAIASVISPFNSYDVSNSVLGRLVSPNTPIQRIGLEMLGKQFGHTVSSLGSAEYQPSANYSNLFDGDPNTKLFNRKVDFQITRREGQTTFQKLVEELTGNYRPINPFKESPTNLDYFRQTGKGQQNLLVDALNKSLYKPSSREWKSTVAQAGFTYDSPLVAAALAGGVPARTYFVGLNEKFYPYSRFYDFGSNVTDASIINARLRTEKQKLYNELESRGFEYEYGSTQSYLDAFGKVDVRTIRQNNDELNDNNDGLDDTTNSVLIWGRDGIDSNYQKISTGFDQNKNQVPSNKSTTQDTTISNFGNGNRFTASNGKPKTGLLNYTKELLNSRGRFANFDLTKKKFIDKDGEITYQGLPFETNAAGEIDRSRQSTIDDPYNRFVKAIRFQGNELYGGNPNSTIYNTVLPKITPRSENGKTDIKNLMFSIENLAAQVSEDGFLKDGEKTQLPLCEVGNQGGRIMWFAPYDIKLSEQSVAKHESTVFLGRSEPIYTYSNSERLATLSFKLIIDYPPHVKGDPTLQTHSQAAKFFAFGGTGKLPRPINIAQKEKELEALKRQKELFTPRKEIDPTPNLPIIGDVSFYFPNDVPNVDSIDFAIDSSISNGYEDGVVDGVVLPTGGTGTSIQSELDGRDYSLNATFINDIKNAVTTAFKEENRGRYEITIEGYSTQLYNSAGSGIDPKVYNLDLSERRIDAMVNYLNREYKTIYGRTLEQDGIEIIRRPIGQRLSPDETATKESIPTLKSKTFRRVTIKFRKIKTFGRLQGITPDFLRINPKTEADLKKIDEQIAVLEKEIAEAKNQPKRGFECTFNQYTIEDGVLKGFEATKREVNKFVPVFHSQTPEDFHRRLTFLQQCVRQGPAIRRQQQNEDGGNIFVAKNAVFGRQPIQILRLGDFFHTKIIIDSIQFEYGEAPWDLNPEGMGMQFMYADINIQMKVIGGMSLKGPIDALQNAVSFNYYANSTFFNDGVYAKATAAENEQYGGQEDVNNNPNINPRTLRDYSEEDISNRSGG